MLQLSVQAEEALKEWREKYGKENSHMVTIEWRQYNLRNAVMMLKNMLQPARVGMWGIQSLVCELAKMVQSRHANRFCMMRGSTRSPRCVPSPTSADTIYSSNSTPQRLWVWEARS